jgi:hypothetical protein
MSTSDDSDIIPPASSPFGQHAYTTGYPTRPPPALFMAAAPHNPVSILSPWRTNVNLPRNIFARQPQPPAPVRPHMLNGIQPNVYRNQARENRTPDTEFQLVTQPTTVPTQIYSGPSTSNARLARRPAPFPIRSSRSPTSAHSTRGPGSPGGPGGPWPVRSSSRSPILAHTPRQQSIELDVLPARVLADHVTVQLPGSPAGDAEEFAKAEDNMERRESNT